ncbi:glutaredoxin-1 [Biomphalaria pfeifferi]|uniref:Glutaredoxin-1 n=1 Tax=Biomphalaria pfeifferi TaxID=112525 RepID=A0AAD8BCG8_BIOPF|nr:glutaredoxin-1 [Biomphalaria pfeifferi]
MGDVKSLVDSKIAGKKVMIFSKQSCPYCTKAKNTFSKYLGNALSEADYEVLEIDELSNCSAIQDYLQKLTGARSVPRVFINQKFVGGGDDVVAKDKSGELKTLLAA